MIHGLDTRGAHLELAGVDHLQQIEIFPLPAREPRLEDRHAVVMQFPPREEIAPPRRAIAHLVGVVSFDEFRSGGDRILDQQVLPFIAGNRESHREDVTLRYRAGQRRGIIYYALAIA